MTRTDEQGLSRLRRGEGADGVSNVELFFDLVFVFAVTQLSHVLVNHPDGEGALHAAVLLVMVWQVWVYTTWSLNYLDPARTVIRALLLALMLGSLVLAASLPEAFQGRGWTVAICYVGMQVGRALFMLYALRGDPLEITFRRIVPWSAVTGVLVLVGAIEHGNVRAALWAASVAIDLAAAAVGFYVPRLGGSETTEWTISGAHFAERCQAFVLIALGESIVVIGATLSGEDVSGTTITAFALAFLGSIGLWWIYFDRTAEDSARRLEESDDPGSLARSAFHWVHPVIVAGIIVASAADEKVLEHPHEHGDTATAALVLGGTALYLAGHALFKLLVWRRVSVPRVAGVVALALCWLLVPHVSGLTLGGCALVVVVGVAIGDRFTAPPRAGSVPS